MLRTYFIRMLLVLAAASLTQCSDEDEKPEENTAPPYLDHPIVGHWHLIHIISNDDDLTKRAQSEMLRYVETYLVFNESGEHKFVFDLDERDVDHGTFTLVENDLIISYTDDRTEEYIVDEISDYSLRLTLKEDSGLERTAVFEKVDPSVLEN